MRSREEGRVPNEGKGKVGESVKAKLDEIRKMSDKELMAFLNANLSVSALKKLMK
jgi:hypothetical protein